MRSGSKALAAALLLAAPLPAAAQDGAGTICVTPLAVWDGGVDDIRAIASAPVPESYKAVRQACGGGARAIDLIDWHLRFGTADTVASALAFVEKRDTGHLDGPAVIVARLERLVAKAERDAQALDALKPDDDGRPGKREIEGRRALANAMIGVSPHIDRLADWLEPAEFYLAAADRFGSAALRNEAERRFVKVEAVLPRIRPPKASAPDPASGERGLAEIFDEIVSDTRFLDRIAAFRIRLALFDAERDPTAEARTRVDGLVAAMRTPALAGIASRAFQAGDDFCDLPDSTDDILLEACRDGNFASKAKAFLVLEARADLLADKTDRAEWVLHLYDRDRKDNGDWETRGRGVDPRIVTLAEGVAEARVRKASQGDKARFPYELDHALEGFVEAARRVNPAQDPVAFRRIAARTLAVDAEISDRARKIDMRRSMRWAGTLSYFRLILAHLDEIAEGRI